MPGQLQSMNTGIRRQLRYELIDSLLQLVILINCLGGTSFMGYRILGLDTLQSHIYKPADSSSFNSASIQQTMYRIVALFSVLVFAAGTIDSAKKPGEVYWNNVLPNTPMPTAIKDLIVLDEYVAEKTGTAVTVGKGGVVVNTPKGTRVTVGHGSVGVQAPKGTNVNVGHGNVGVHTGKGTNVNVGHGHVSVVPKGRKPGGGTGVNVGKGGVVVNTPHKKKPVHVNVSPFIYNYEATDTQVQTDPSLALFFLEKDLKLGNKITLHFTPITSASTFFISRKEVASIPFTSSKLPSILKHFSLHPDSIEAEYMKKTLLECEEPAMAGERKICATSLETMVEFTTSSLGTRNLIAVSTSVSKEMSPKQQYKIESFKTLPGSNMVVCHAQTYAYAVFYCHTTKGTKAYEIRMAGNDGTKVEAVAVCHTDTAAWNPKHIAFRVLHVKPGSVPVCHFLPQDHIVWAGNK